MTYLRLDEAGGEGYDEIEGFNIKSGGIAMKRIFGLLLCMCLMMSLCTVGALAAEESFADQNGVSWVYTDGAEKTLTMIRDSGQTIENASALLISSEVNGAAVRAVQSNGFDNVVVGHKANEYILIAEGIEEIGGAAFYDFNFVKSVSIPASVTDVNFNAFDVLGREINNSTVIYGAAGSAAEDWAADNSTAVYTFVPTEGSNFTVTASEGGEIYPCGAFYVPDGMKAESISADFSVSAQAGYVIDELVVDGDIVEAAGGQSEWLLSYAFSENSNTVSVTFRTADGTQTGAEEQTITLQAGETTLLSGDAVVEVPDGAVADGVDVSDLYDAPDDSAAGYMASMGVSTGDWYVLDGALYEMVFAVNGSGEHGDSGLVFRCKAQVVNYLFEQFGWVYGADYDLIRLYHFDSTVTGGNRKGAYDYHCAFVYKLVDDDGAYDALTGEEAFYSENENTAGITNNSTLFVQATAGTGSVATVEGLTALNHTRPDGPQEATNFYGIGSAVLVDGGTASMNSYRTTLFDSDEAAVVELTDPWIVGGANPIYVLASARANIHGGTLFTAFSGGHGPYVSLQGQITINADENIVDENGVVNTDVENLKETVLADIPGRFGWAERNIYADGTAVDANDYSTDHSRLVLDEEAIADYEQENGDVTVVTTANSSGSLLVTDSGGGIVVANRLSGVAYSTGSSGIYSMGGGSYVYVYNSRLESHIEPAINSVGEGYVFAFNSSFTGPVGVLSSGGSEHVNIYNSTITTEIDFDMDFYDLTDPNDPEQLATYEQLLGDVESAELVNSNYLMIFPLNGDDMGNFVSNWFEDRTQVPGKNGGNIALLSTTSASGIVIDSTKLTNNAYAVYGSEGVPNWLIAAAGGTSTFTFRNENSRTRWDLTGADDSTTELYGNIYCAPSSGSGMWVTAEGAAVVELINSEWTGTIEDRGQGVTLKLDGESVWTVTGSCDVSSLTLEDGAAVCAAEGCELQAFVDGEPVELGEGVYENVSILVTRNDETVYDGLYARPETETETDAAQTDGSGEMNTEAASANGSGEMSGEGASGEASGDMGGGIMFSTGASNCSHGTFAALSEITWSFDASGVAEIAADADGITLTALAPGQTTLELTRRYMDGTEETESRIITVTEP